MKIIGRSYVTWEMVSVRQPRYCGEQRGTGARSIGFRGGRAP